MGEAYRLPVKKPDGRDLNLAEHTYNRVFHAVHGIGERSNSLLKTTFKALRGSACALGESARSPAPPSSYSTPDTIGCLPHMQDYAERSNGAIPSRSAPPPPGGGLRRSVLRSTLVSWVAEVVVGEVPPR